MTEQLFIVQGRSIDGTVYYGGNDTWHSDRADAVTITREEAGRVIDAQLERNKNCDVDDTIGHLRVQIK